MLAMHSMNLSTTTRRRLGHAAALGGATWAAMGVLHLSGAEGLDAGTKVETTAAHLNLAGFSLALLLTAAGIIALSERARDRRGPIVAVAGMVLLAVAGTVSNVMGHDPTFFLVAAPVGNLAWLAGTIATAVSVRRTGGPRWILALPLVQVFALPFADVGGPLIAGAYWIALGAMLAADALERREPVLA
jgi:hypothetical protein